MPPKKDPTVTLKGKQAEDKVLEYLNEQNRPWGATDISANLSNAVSRANAAKILDTLAQQGKVICKEYGKAKMYGPLQPDEDNWTAEETEEAEAEEKRLMEEGGQLKEQLSEVNARKRALDDEPPTHKLAEMIKHINHKSSTLSASLAPLLAAAKKAQAATGAPSNALDARLPAVLKDLQAAHAAAKGRKKWVKDVTQTIAPNVPEGEDLWETLGVDEWPEGEGKGEEWAKRVLEEGEKEASGGAKGAVGGGAVRKGNKRMKR